MNHNAGNVGVMRGLGRAALNLMWIAISAYGTVMILWLVLKLGGATVWVPVEMLSSLLPVLLLPSLVIVPLCLLRRRWRLALLSLPTLLTFLIGYGVFFVPRIVSAKSDAARFSFLTYNIHAESVQLEPLLEVIRAADADIVALQEVSPAMAEALAEQLRVEYPYQALHPNTEDPIWGQGVLSRYPILEDEYWHISLGHQRVKLEVNGRPLVLYNTHPVHPFRIREGQLFDMQPHQREVDEVLRRAALDSGSVIIAGDLNMTDQADDYRRMTQHFRDTYREEGWGLGFTFPDFSQKDALPFDASLFTAIGRPVARIDFIFHNDDLQAISTRVWPTSGGSDHRPVVAEFAIK